MKFHECFSGVKTYEEYGLVISSENEAILTLVKRG